MKLDRKSIKLLRCLSRQSSLDSIGLIIYTPYEYEDILKCLDFLLKHDLIQIDASKGNSSSFENSFFQISKSGEAFLQHHTMKVVLTLITIILSTITTVATIISAIAVL